MAIERTFSIIKPDAVRRNLIGNILAVFEKNGLRPVALKKIKAASGRPFCFASAATTMSSPRKRGPPFAIAPQARNRGSRFRGNDPVGAILIEQTAKMHP